MKKNFNQTTVIILASVAALSSNAIKPLNTAGAQSIAKSPELFEACAAEATTYPNNVIDSTLNITASIGKHTMRATATIETKQMRLIIPPGQNDHCTGTLRVNNSLQLRGGSFKRTLPGIGVNKVFKYDNYPEVAQDSGSFSYKAACREVRRLKGKGQKAAVTANIEETITYREDTQSYSNVFSYPAISLPCSRPRSTGFIR